MSKVSKLVPKKTKYDLVKERFEELHKKRRELEGKLRQFSRANTFGFEPWRDEHRVPAAEYAKKLNETKKTLGNLKRKEKNIYADLFIDSIDDRLEILDEMEEPQLQLNILFKEKVGAKYAYENFQEQDRNTKERMSPEGMSSSDFAKKLLDQYAQYASTHQHIDRYYDDRGYVQTFEESGKYYLKISDLTDKLGSLQKICSESDWPSDRDLKLEREQTMERIAIHYRKNEDFIVKEKFPEVDIVEHYANRFLGKSEYLVIERTDPNPTLDYHSIKKELPIGEWEY